MKSMDRYRLPKTSFPLKACCSPDGITVSFTTILPARFHDSFCHETLERCGTESNLVRSFSWAQVFEIASVAAEPAGVIFHISRCGSTLVSQLLKQIASLVVYSEPPALNDLLMHDEALTRAQQEAAVRFLCCLLGWHASARYVLKLRSWNSLKCDIVLAALKSVPWAFIIRDPLEVAVSVLERPPTWLRARQWQFNPFERFLPEGHRSASNEHYVAVMLKAFCNALLDVDDTGGILVEYPDLPSAVWDRVAPHFALPLVSSEQRAMVDASLSYSKCVVGQCFPFSSDSAAKQARATDQLRRSITLHAAPAIARVRMAVTSRITTP